MSKLYYKINESIISDELKNVILEKSLYRLSISGTYDCVGVVAPVNHPEIVWLFEQCNLKFYTMIVTIPPKFTIPRHIDPPRRTTLLAFPINPKINYSSTVFYNFPEALEDDLVCHYDNLNPVFLNGAVEHDVHNTSDEYRINFQLCFHESFDFVVDKYIKKELFKFQRHSSYFQYLPIL